MEEIPIQLIEGVELRNDENEAQITEGTEHKKSSTDYQSIAAAQRVDLLGHLRQLKKSIEETDDKCQKLLEKLEPTANSIDGISLLQVRNHCFAEYLENLAEFSAARTSGQPVNSAVDSLVSNKCVMEKIKPLQNQLKYQLQKYEEIEKNAPVNLRPNPASMLKTLNVSQETSMDGKHMVAEHYQPPEVMAALFPKEKENQEKESKYARSTKAHAKASVLMDEVAAEYSNNPLEIDNAYGSQVYQKNDRKVQDFMKRMKEIQEIEEETMHRLPLSKKDRQMRKQLEQSQGLGQILDFGQVSNAKKEKKKNKKNQKH